MVGYTFALTKKENIILLVSETERNFIESRLLPNKINVKLYIWLIILNETFAVLSLISFWTYFDDDKKYCFFSTIFPDVFEIFIYIPFGPLMFYLGPILSRLFFSVGLLPINQLNELQNFYKCDIIEKSVNYYKNNNY